MRLLHLADLHLGSRHPDLGERAAQREAEIQDSFRRAVEFALDKERAIDAVLISGNLFDGHHPDEAVFNFARGLFGRLHAENIPVLLLPGARDGYGYRDSVYRTERLPGVTIFTEEDPSTPVEMTIAEQRVWVHAAVGRADVSPPKFPGFRRGPKDGLHLGLLCAPLFNSDEFEDRPRVWHVHDAQVAEFDLDYVALGGMHAFNSVESGGRVFGAWPGTLEGRRFEAGDLGEKSLLVVDIGEDRRPRLERHPFSRRRLESWSIHLEQEAVRDQRDLLAALQARASEDVIARVTIEGPASFLPDVDRLSALLEGAYFHLELVDRCELLGGPLVRRIEGERTIRGVFVRHVLQRIRDLEARAAQAGETSPLWRELEVARLGLRVGLEHFLEEEPLDLAPVTQEASPQSNRPRRVAPSRSASETAGEQEADA